ncbi:MAG: HYR domain-containing protein, partial [Acidobacteriota bacterium]
MVPNVDSTTGHSFSITAAGSVILTAPQFSDGGGQLLGWTNSDGATITPIPNTNNTQVCVQGFDDATHVIEAVYSPGIQTLDSTCANVKTLFDVGETMCVRVTGAAPGAMTPWNVLVAGGSVNECTFFGPLSVTMETQTFMIILPSDNSEIPAGCASNPTTDIRGNWRAVLRDFTNTNRAQKNFRLHDPNNPAADVSISKSLTDNQGYPPGGTAHYLVSVQNNGPDPASNVVVTEDVPANTTFISWTQISGPPFMLSGPAMGNVTASIASLNADTSASFELAVMINNGVADGTQIDNTVSVTSDTTDLFPSNNTATAPIIVSTNACQLVCPPNMTVPDMGAPGEVVMFSNPTTIGGGSCGSIQCTPASGSVFPQGTTTVTCIGINQGFCTFTITVTASASCVLDCPDNITVSNDPGQCNAVVSFVVGSTDDCGDVMCNPASGSMFPVGTTTVMCDASGTMSNPDCTFTVTVNDTENPSFTSCPANIQAVSSQGCSSAPTAMVNYSAPVATDNCPGVMVACVPPSGSVFPTGTTTVTCTATDAQGLTDTCSFSVTVFGA